MNSLFPDRLDSTPTEFQAGWLQQIVDHERAVFYIKDLEGRYRLINRTFEHLFKRSAHQVVGRPDEEIFPAELAERFRNTDRRTLETGAALEVEETMAFEGRQRTFKSLKFPLSDTEGRINAICGIGTEITHSRQIEEALHNAALGIHGVQGEDIFRAMVRFLAVTLDLDAVMISIPAPDDPEQVQALAFYEGGQFVEDFRYPLAGSPCAMAYGREFRCVPRDVRARFPNDVLLQETSYVSHAAFPLFDSNNRPIGLISALDDKPLENPELIESMFRIFSARAAAELERRQAVEQLRAREEQYRAIFEASVDGLGLWSEDGQLVDVNPAFARMHGYERRELFSLDPLEMIHPDSHEAFRTFLASIDKDRTFHTEARNLCRDGRIIEVEVSGVPMRYQGRSLVLGVVRDISERKQAERERELLRDQLHQAQKMETIGHLTGGIAHDFNNILSGVMGYLVMALERQEQEPLQDGKTAQYLERALHSGQRARDLIQQMLTFSRGQPLNPNPLYLAPLVQEITKLLSATLPASVQLSTDCRSETPRVLLDRVRIEQVLMNLCINARDAMGGSGCIEIRLDKARQDQVCTSCRLPVHGEFVELVVTDDGPGIPAAVMERMFEPFFSTKEAGKGSGMGLAMVHGIVHDHGGHIVVETSYGQGTAFRILLPPAPSGDDAQLPAASQPDPEVLQRLAGRILVVEDDPMVAEFMGELLDSWGLDTTLAGNGSEAEAALADRSFALVITDQSMPGMTGLELAGRLKEAHPGLPVILSTGTTEILNEERIRASSIRTLIRKPVDFDELFQVLRQALPCPG